ncbi:MAG: hypothetical protein MZV63_56415 [Marinilabiliales bacterium]|nr:hypothetical protein [Marinilabiliales bacterium]
MKIYYLPVLFMAIVIGSEWMATEATRIWFHAAQLLASTVLVVRLPPRDRSLVRKLLDR